MECGKSGESVGGGISGLEGSGEGDLGLEASLLLFLELVFELVLGYSLSSPSVLRPFS